MLLCSPLFPKVEKETGIGCKLCSSNTTYRGRRVQLIIKELRWIIPKCKVYFSKSLIHCLSYRGSRLSATFCLYFIHCHKLISVAQMTAFCTFRLYHGSELSTHFSGCLKQKKINPGLNFFVTGRRFRRQCVNTIHTT